MYGFAGLPRWYRVSDTESCEYLIISCYLSRVVRLTGANLGHLMSSSLPLSTSPNMVKRAFDGDICVVPHCQLEVCLH